MLFRSNDTATTEIYTLSLHDALPIFRAALLAFLAMEDARMARVLAAAGFARAEAAARIVMSVIHSLAVRTRAGTPRAEMESIAADCIALLA